MSPTYHDFPCFALPLPCPRQIKPLPRPEALLSHHRVKGWQYLPPCPHYIPVLGLCQKGVPVWPTPLTFYPINKPLFPKYHQVPQDCSNRKACSSGQRFVRWPALETSTVTESPEDEQHLEGISRNPHQSACFIRETVVSTHARTTRPLDSSLSLNPANSPAVIRRPS